jgi:hypothetical protein
MDCHRDHGSTGAPLIKLAVSLRVSGGIWLRRSPDSAIKAKSSVGPWMYRPAAQRAVCSHAARMGGRKQSRRFLLRWPLCWL